MKHTGSVPFIYASAISALPGVLDDQGGRVDRPFREAGVPVELASEPEQVLPMRGYLALFEAAARETGDEFFGVSLGERTEISDLGTLGHLITGAPTLCRAIAVTDIMIRYFSPTARCRLEIDAETALWHYRLTPVGDFHEALRLDSEYSLFLFRAVVRLAAGPDWQPNEILLAQATPHQLRSLQSRLGAPTRVGGTGYALVFPRDLLDLPMTYAKPLGKMKRRALLAQLISSGPEGSFIGSLRAIVRGQLYGGYPEMSSVARATGLSVRTFQRRLAEQGLAYSELVADVRRDLAREMLADPSRSQLDITLSLGYSDAANFSRAFKQWTGMAPSEFRRSMLPSPAAT